MKKIFTALCGCAALLLTGCIDREFELTEVSGEVTVGGEELVVPLADINNIYLSDLLKGNDVVTNDDNGVYRIYFSSFGDNPDNYESISIDKIEIPAIVDLSPKLEPMKFDLAQLPESLTLDNISEVFSIDFPTIGEAVKVQPIQVSQALGITLPDVLPNSGEITDDQLAYLPALGKGINCSYNDSTAFNAELSILEQLEKITHVYFEENTTLNIVIALNGIAGINGGGTLNLNMEFPEGYGFYEDSNYEQQLPLVEKNGKMIPTLSREISIEKNQTELSLTLYLKEIDYSNHSFSGGILNINDEITYSYDLKLNLCSGEYNLSQSPTFTISATPKYKDIEVVINHFDLPSATYAVEYKFENLPKEIDINEIAFSEDSAMSLKLTGLEWIRVKDNITKEEFSPYLVVKFPSCMHFSRAELADPASISNLRSSDLHLGGDREENKDRDYILTASAEALANGIKLYIDHIDGKDSSIARIEDALVIDTTVEAEVHLESLDGHTILASSIVPPSSPLNVVFGMSDMNFTIDKERSKVEMNEMVLDLDISNQLPSLSQEIEVPEMISSIKAISIGKANGNGEPVAIDFSLGTLNGSTFPIDEIELDVAINIGNLLRPTKETEESGLITRNDKGECILSIKQNWQPNIAPLSAHLEFDGLDNIPTIVNGKLKLDQAIKIERCYAKIKDGQNIDLTAINNAAIDMQITIDDIEVRQFTGGINLSVAPEEMVVEVGDLSNLGVNINELSLNPVLKLNLNGNPTGIPFFANIAVKTYDAEGSQLAEITVPEIVVPASKDLINIVISTPSNKGNYKDLVVVENLSQLLSNGIPAKIAVNMSVATNKDEIYTIDLADAKEGYKFEYQYEVIVPLEFDGNVNLSYETTISGLNETFAGLADDMQGLKVGDVGLVAELGTTIPFDIKLEAKLVNADGTDSGIDATLKIGNDGVIEGWSEKEDGNNPHISKLDIEFSLGDSHSLKALESVDGVALSFSLYKSDTDEVASIKDSQYLNGKLKLRVRDGLTIDIFDFLKGEGE